jgi:hypothetical protein
MSVISMRLDLQPILALIMHWIIAIIRQIKCALMIQTPDQREFKRVVAK